jgi:hypothetical protein
MASRFVGQQCAAAAAAAAAATVHVQRLNGHLRRFVCWRHAALEHEVRRARCARVRVSFETPR